MAKSNALGAFRKALRKNGKGYLYLAPFLVLFAIFTVIPVIMSFYMSFTTYDLINPPVYVGIDNYRELFMGDEIFLLSLQNTFVFAAVIGPVSFFSSFFFAWVISRLKFRNAFALAFYAPSVTSSVAMSVIWLYFFSNDRMGLINNILIWIGIITRPILWLSDTRTIMLVVMIVSIWMSMGTGFLVFLAGIQTIPKEYYEAARIDGIKSGFQELRFVVWPSMKPQLLFGSITSIVNAFGIFDIAVSLCGMPSPNYAAHTIVAHLYDYAFIRFDMGYASAVATILFLITFFCGRIAMKIFATHDV